MVAGWRPVGGCFDDHGLRQGGRACRRRPRSVAQARLHRGRALRNRERRLHVSAVPVRCVYVRRGAGVCLVYGLACCCFLCARARVCVVCAHFVYRAPVSGVSEASGVCFPSCGSKFHVSPVDNVDEIFSCCVVCFCCHPQVDCRHRPTRYHRGHRTQPGGRGSQARGGRPVPLLYVPLQVSCCCCCCCCCCCQCSWLFLADTAHAGDGLLLLLGWARALFLSFPRLRTQGQ